MPRLEVFVSRHCFGCREARRLARAVAERFTAVTVRVVDLEAEPEARPDPVVAVPAYLLDGRIVALGNPRQADLFQQVARALAAEEAS